VTGTATVDIELRLLHAPLQRRLGIVAEVVAVAQEDGFDQQPRLDVRD